MHHSKYIISKQGKKGRVRFSVAVFSMSVVFGV